MKLRINAKLRAALIAAVSTVGFTLTQAQAATLYTQPTFGGPEYHWVDGAWQEGDPARQDKKGPVLNFEDVGIVNISGGIPDTSDNGGIRVTGDSTVTTSLGGWAGYIVVGKGASLTASYNNDLKSDNLGENEASVYVEGQLKITGRANLWMTDGNSAHRWLIGEEGFVDLSAVSNVVKSAGGWDIQLNVDAGEPMSLEGYTNRSLGGQLTKKFMSTGADLYGKVNNWAVFREGEELDSSKYTINHNASGMSVTYDAESAIKKMSLTWAGGVGTWEEKGTHWRSAGVETSFANGDDVTFTGSGNVASLSGAIVADTLTVAEGGSTTLNIAGGASLAANTTNIQGATLTLSGSGSVDLGATNFSNGNLVIDGREYSLGNQSHALKTLTVKNGGVVTTTHDGSDGAVRGDIIIQAGSTFRVASGHDAFGWGDGYGNSTKNIILSGTEGQVALLDIQGDNSSCTLGSAIQMNGYASITQKSGKAAFNANGCSITATGTHNNIDRFQIRKSMTIAVNGADSTLEVGQMTKHNEGDKVLTKNGDGTLIFTGGGAMSKLVQTAGTTRFDNGSTIDALEYTGGSLVFAGGTNTVSGSANVLNNAISVTGGKLILNGSYAIDEIALDEGSTVNYYNTEEQLSSNGFRSEDGSKTIYTVNTEAGAQIDRESAIFTVGGHGVDVGNDGKYLVTGTVDYTVLWANDSTPVDYATYKEYATGKGAASLAVRGTANGTVNMGDNGTIDSLVFDANGVSAGLAGTGTITAISGTGTLILRDGARVSVPDVTVSNDRGIYSTGAGTLVMNALYVDNNASRVEFDSATEIALIEHTGGIITFGGNGITHNVTGLKLSMRGGRASTVNVAEDATLHITGTEIATAGGGGSFAVSHWNSGGNTINVNGTLISEAIISGWDGEATINVENGGTLELRAGLNRNDARDNAINLNIKSGATLVAGTATTGTDKDSLHVNLNDGSTFKGYYGAGDTATIARAITFGSGTVTIDVESGKTLQLNSNIAGEGVTIAKTGAGELALNGNANVLYNAITVQAGTLALNGTFDLSHITHEQGTVKYFKDDQPGTEESDNGFAKYVGEVQLVNGLRENVTQGASATLTLDGYNVTYDAATGKAVSNDISLGTYYINTGSETLSEIQQVSLTAGVSMKGGTTLVADANFSGSLTVTGDGNGKLVISKDKLVSATAPNQALELSGEGTYTLGSTLSLGKVTLGNDWTGIVRVTDYTPDNAQNIGAVVRGTNSTVELMGFKGWDNNWNGTVNYNVKLTNGSDGYAWQNGAFGGGQQTEMFTGTWSGDGMFQVVGATGDRTMHYTYSGNIKDWTGEFQKDGKQVTNLTFTGSAKDVNITISHVAGAAALNVIADAEGIVFSKGVDANAFTANVATTLKGETTIDSFSGAGALTVDADENTVTLNGGTLDNTIAVKSGTLQLDGAFDITGNQGEMTATYSDGLNGFMTTQGTITVYTKEAGAEVTIVEGTQFFYDTAPVELTIDGTYEAPAHTDYSTFYVRVGSANFSSALAQEDMQYIEMSDNTTLNVDADGALTALTTHGAASLANEGQERHSLTLGSVEGEGSVTVSDKIDVTIAGTITGTMDLTAMKLASGATAHVTMGGGNAEIVNFGGGEGTVVLEGGSLSYRSNLGGNTLQLQNGSTLLFGNKGDDTTHTYAGEIVVAGSANVTTYGTSQHPTATISGSVTGDGTLTRINDGNQTLAFTGTVNLGGYTNNDGNDGNLTDFQGATNIGTLTIGNANAKTKFSHEDTTIGIIAMNTNATVEIAGNTSVGAVSGSKDLTLNVTNDATATLTGTSSFNKLVSTGKVVVDQDAVVTLSNNLTPNSGTVEVNGTVSANHEVDLSNNGASMGILKVGSTGVVSTKDGMWMAKSAAVQLAEGGTFNIAGLQIIGENGGASLTTTADNGQYGTNNAAFIITNAAVSGTTNINLGNKLVNSTLTTGAYTMTLNNAASTYDAVYVSTGGTLVVNADIDLAGVLHSSGAITVNEEKSLTLTEGSSLFQTVTNNGAVSLTGITLGGGFSEQTEGSAYYDIDGNVTTEDQNHYEGTATTYVQVVDGGTSTGTGLIWNEKAYDLSENTGRIIVGQGGADYRTFYVVNGSVNISALNEGTTKVEVEGGTLVVDNPAAGISIDVTGTGTISGEAVNPTQVGIDTWSTAKFDQPVEEAGVKFTAAQGEAVNITNLGDKDSYSTENKLMNVQAQTLEMTADTNVTVSNTLWGLEEVVNETGHVLTLDNIDSLALDSMIIGGGSTVRVLYDLDEQTKVEGTVTITESLTAGGATLLANLVMTDGSTLDLQTGEGAMAALTLGSNLAFVDGGLVILDATTLAKLDELVMGTEGNYLELVHAATGTTLTYGEDGTADYNGMWFGQLFDRPDTLIGDFKVFATGETFGLTKVSNVPEPTTGTLSLLALAALAARRRKH